MDTTQHLSNDWPKPRLDYNNPGSIALTDWGVLPTSVKAGDIDGFTILGKGLKRFPLFIELESRERYEDVWKIKRETRRELTELMDCGILWLFTDGTATHEINGCRMRDPISYVVTQNGYEGKQLEIKGNSVLERWQDVHDLMRTMFDVYLAGANYHANQG